MLGWTLVNVKGTDNFLSCGQIEICSVKGHILLICKLRTNFIAKSKLLSMGCPLTREHKQKKKTLFSLSKVSMSTYKRVLLT